MQPFRMGVRLRHRTERWASLFGSIRCASKPSAQAARSWERQLALAAPAALALALLAFPAPAAASPLGTAGPARVQAPAPPQMTEACPGLIARRPVPVVPASLRLAQLKEGEVRITFVGHSTFLIESPQLVRIATDYNDYVKPPVLPHIATMNRAHSTHYTDNPDPGIAHVLRGWGEGEGPALHDVEVRDVRVRNVPTNIRSWDGGTQRHGNSIFVFEVANLCIAHLGHLHHTLTQIQLNEIGRVDVVLVPVDGSYTLDIEGMMEVLQSLGAQLMIPMHYFGTHTLNRFLDRAREHFAVAAAEIPSLLLSKAALPEKPTVMVLPGR